MFEGSQTYKVFGEVSTQRTYLDPDEQQLWQCNNWIPALLIFLEDFQT